MMVRVLKASVSVHASLHSKWRRPRRAPAEGMSAGWCCGCRRWGTPQKQGWSRVWSPFSSGSQSWEWAGEASYMCKLKICVCRRWGGGLTYTRGGATSAWRNKTGRSRARATRPTLPQLFHILFQISTLTLYGFHLVVYIVQTVQNSHCERAHTWSRPHV